MSQEEPVTQPRGRISHGSVLCDFNTKEWKIKSFINITGSTETYEAEIHNNEGNTDYPGTVVIKVEVDKNGPLSTEMQFYTNYANPSNIEDWVKTRSLQNYGLGIPLLLGSGCNEYNGIKYNFIVLEQFSKNLGQLFVENGRKFPEHTVYKIAYQTLRALQYIHAKGYVHGNIKGENLFIDSENESHVYLTNYALALTHSIKKYKVNPKGASLYRTSEYMSRDDHFGVSTMRGDIESLLYNMIRWSCDYIPWEDSLEDSCAVELLKQNAFKDPTQFLKNCFKTSDVPPVMAEFISLVANMKRYDKPKYGQFRDILTKGLRKLFHVPTGILQFKVIVVHRSPLPKKKEGYIKGLQVSVKLLAAIISENCRNLNEVDLQATEPGAIMDIIHKLTNIHKSDELKIKILQDAWRKNVGNLKTRVIELWKRKGINVTLAPTEEHIDKEMNQDPLAMPNQNIPGTSASDSHLELANQNETPSLVFPSTLTPEVKEMQQMSSSVKRKMEGDQEETMRSAKRRLEYTDEEDEQLYVLNEPSKDDDNLTRQHSLTPSRHRSSSSLTRPDNPPATDRQSFSDVRSPSTLKSNRVRSPSSPGSSSGFSSHRSSGNDFRAEDSIGSKTPMLSLDEWRKKCKRLDTWLRLKDQTLGALGSISLDPETADSQTQEVEVFRDEFSDQKPLLDELAKAHPVGRDDVEMLEDIEQRWRYLLKRLKERGRKLSDARLDQLLDALQNTEDSLRKLQVDGDREEPILSEIDILVGKLDAQWSLLENAKTMGDHLCEVFSDSKLSNDIRTKLRRANLKYHDLKSEIDSRKVEIGKRVNDRREFDDSCKNIFIWIDNELASTTENVLVKTDREMLQQLQHHEAAHQRVMGKRDEVEELLYRSRNFFAKSQSTVDKRFLGLIQSKWISLEKRSLENYEKLKICAEFCNSYYQARDVFISYLSEAKQKLESFTLFSFKNEGDVKKQQEKLSFFSVEVRVKSCELEQINSLGNKFIGSCDKDKDDMVKNELADMKTKWDKLNSSLLERMQSLESMYEQLAGISKSLRDLNDKLKLCEDKFASHDSLGEAAKDPKFHDVIKELSAELESLQEPLDIVRQKADDLVIKSVNQKININYILDGVEKVTGHIKNLKTKLTSNLDEIHPILEQEVVGIEQEIKIERKVIPVQQQIEEKPLKLLTPAKINLLLDEIIDLVSDDDEEDPEVAAINAAAMQQHAESSQHQKYELENCAQAHENELNKGLKNDEESLKAVKQEEKSREKFLEKTGDVGNDNSSPPKCNKKTDDMSSKRSQSRHSDTNNAKSNKSEDNSKQKTSERDGLNNSSRRRSKSPKNNNGSPIRDKSRGTESRPGVRFRNDFRSSPARFPRQDSYKSKPNFKFRPQTPWVDRGRPYRRFHDRDSEFRFQRSRYPRRDFFYNKHHRPVTPAVHNEKRRDLESNAVDERERTRKPDERNEK